MRDASGVCMNKLDKDRSNKMSYYQWSSGSVLVFPQLQTSGDWLLVEKTLGD